MEIKLTPTGKLVQGSLFDCNKKRLERMLKDYDKQLYLKWNPKKNKGWGCWELRRRPNQKTLITHDCGDFVIHKVAYKENDLVHHVLDLEYLSYSVLDRLREMDAWENKRLIADGDYEAERRQDREYDKYVEDRRHAIRQDKKYWKEYLELVRSGYNPAWFFADDKKK